MLSLGVFGEDSGETGGHEQQLCAICHNAEGIQSPLDIPHGEYKRDHFNQEAPCVRKNG
jgi:hypothetical protein